MVEKLGAALKVQVVQQEKNNVVSKLGNILKGAIA